MALIKRNTAYSVNDIVNTKYGTKLKCTTAGTTSTDPLILDGTSTITDGTVVWEVQEEGGGTGQGLVDYEANKQYKVGDIVIYDDKIYRCITAHTSTSTFDVTKWEELSGAGIAIWQPNTAYEVQDIVIYNYVIYMCREAHTSATDFEYNKWIIIGGGGNGDYGDYVGHITWQMSLQSNYLKLDGTPLADASSDYAELLEYAQNNNLITADTTDKSLFKYDSTNDVLTLPDYIGLCLQGGNSVEEKEAGLPNITGVSGGGAQWSTTTPSSAFDLGSTGVFSDSKFGLNNDAFTYQTQQSGGHLYWISPLDFKASNSNSIYSDSVNTVQPPAITLIPQIRYKYSGNTYSTEEKLIGTWIDGKPLYRRVFTGTAPSSANVYTNIFTDSLFTNVDMCYVKDGYIKWDAGSGDIDFYTINESNDSAYSSRIFISCSESSIRGAVGQQFTSRPLVVIVEYTKTTD